MNKFLAISYTTPSLLTLLLLSSLVSCTTTDTSTTDVPSTVNTNTSGFDCHKVDKELTEYLAIDASSSHRDAMQKAYGLFKRRLTDYAQQAGSMQCSFALAKAQGLIVKTSDDNNVRLIAWNKKNSATMQEYEGLYQFKDTQGKLHLRTGNGYKAEKNKYLLEGIPNALFTATLHNKVTYMLASTGMYSNKVHNQLLQLWTINGDNLQPANIIKTNFLGSTLTFKYDFFSVVDRPERPIQLFKYDQQTKTIRFPVVVKDSKYPSGKVTNKSISYKFDGKYFQRMKN